jgi:hypothetical protein
LLAVPAVISACTIAIAASSGGALLTMALGIIAFGFCRFWNQMRLIRCSLLALILTLAIIMQAPVWYLFARASNVVGGGGWYRSFLVDTTISHIQEWWLCGTTHTSHWAPACFVLAEDSENIDITSQYIAEGVRGGLVKLILFIVVIVQCFKALGRRIWLGSADCGNSRLLFWTLGVCLFTHCVSFWSIPYFDQMAVLWYWLLAVISRIACDEPEEELLPGESETGSTSHSHPVEVQA